MPTTMDDKQEVEISNPVLGRLAAKGVRVSDLIGLLTFVAVIGGGVLVWKNGDALARHSADTAATNRDIATSIKQSATAQRLMTCIISVPQERREAEFISANSFCQRMANLP